jgi:hypothetical protein
MSLNFPWGRIRGVRAAINEKAQFLCPTLPFYNILNPEVLIPDKPYALTRLLQPWFTR